MSFDLIEAQARDDNDVGDRVGCRCFARLFFLGSNKLPIAVVQVVDGGGRPVANATVTPQGLRPRGPYGSGWYPWESPKRKAPKNPVTTGSDGFAHVPYPNYVSERLQTGVIIFMVSHPDFVSQQIEFPVNPPGLPLGAPLSSWITFFKDRFSHQAVAAAPKPIALAKGATLQISVQTNSGGPSDGVLRALLATTGSTEAGFWTNPAPEILLTRRLSAGSHLLQAVQMDSAGIAWFSDVKTISAVEGRTNDLTVDLKRGFSFRGQIDPDVPRPVKNGRVIVNVAPPGIAFSSHPPQWHAWTSIREDGRFQIRGLPAGDVEVIAFCDGFVSTNGPGKYHFHYPQKYALSNEDVSVTVGMERTACLDVTVLDGDEKPLKDASVALWPNARYGEWSAVVLGSDCYNTSDYLAPNSGSLASRPRTSAFTAKTDASGLAVISNLPVEASEFSVDHPEWTLRPVTGFAGQQYRQQSVTLAGGQTNHINVKLERRNASVIRQY